MTVQQKKETIKAWRNKTYRNSLSKSQKANILPNPAGNPDFTKKERKAETITANTYSLTCVKTSCC